MGRLLAAGRDCDIYEHGPGTVLRRSRAGRSLAGEARIMEYARAQGYPVPAVVELADEDRAMVLERIEGPSMVELLGRRPWTVRGQGRLLAELHARLHDIEAPTWLAPAPCGEGARLLHLDLHPLNVLVGPSGPVVIDWTGAARGAPEVDVALAWALMACGGIPGGRVRSALLGLGRELLVRSFLAGYDVESVRRALPVVVAWKVGDPHMSEAECAAMEALAAGARVASSSGGGPG